MEADWLAASSFERTYEIVSAINTLSIHVKLVVAGKVDPTAEADIQQARSRLLKFLTSFEELLRDAEREDKGTVMGADPRLAELAHRYRSASRRWPRPSAVFDRPLTELRELVQSERQNDYPALIACLRGLRLVLEQFSRADVAGILGEV